MQWPALQMKQTMFDSGGSSWAGTSYLENAVKCRGDDSRQYVGEPCKLVPLQLLAQLLEVRVHVNVLLEPAATMAPFRCIRSGSSRDNRQLIQGIATQVAAAL